MRFFTKILKKLEASPPATFLVNKSKHIFLPGFRGIPLYDVIKFFFGQVKTIGMTERASAIAFNLVMAIPPAMIFLFTLIPFFPIPKEFENQLYGVIRDVIPGEKDNSVLIGFLQNFINTPRSGLLSLGFILSIYFSSSAMMGIMRSFDKNYLGFKKRTNFQRRIVAMKLTSMLFFLMIFSLLLLVAQGSVLNLIGIRAKWLKALIINARWVVIVFLFFASVSYIYRHAPSIHKKWKLINPGSILATFLMILTSVGFSYWVSHFGNYNKLYGSIGTVLILMILIYFNSLILLIGFELNVSISSLKRIADERENSPANGNEMSA
jgi:membrane protein